MTVGDPTQVHLISLTPDLDQYQAVLNTTYKWHAYFPAGSQWRLCWGAGQIPPVGVPKDRKNSQLLEMQRGTDGTCILSCAQGPRLDPGMSLVFRCGEEVSFAPVPAETLRPFGDTDRLVSEHSGNVSGRAETESYAVSGPIVLLRQWRDTSRRANRREGFVLWLEPVMN